MKQKNDRIPSTPSAAAPAPKTRFHLRRLEERIAPKRGGKGTNNCPLAFTEACVY
jgi:hypothetical protein